MRTGAALTSLDGTVASHSSGGPAAAGHVCSGPRRHRSTAPRRIGMQEISSQRAPLSFYCFAAACTPPPVWQAEYLASLPFDGFAIGGSLGRDRAEMLELLAFLMPHIPEAKPNHLLGIADPESAEAVVPFGVDTMDSCNPTRIARHGMLLTTAGSFSCISCQCAMDSCIRDMCGSEAERLRCSEALGWPVLAHPFTLLLLRASENQATEIRGRFWPDRS